MSNRHSTPAKFLDVLVSAWAGFSGMLVCVSIGIRGIYFALRGFISDVLGLLVYGLRYGYVNQSLISLSIIISLFLFTWRLIKTKKTSYLLVAIGTGVVTYVIFMILFIIDLARSF